MPKTWLAKLRRLTPIAMILALFLGGTAAITITTARPAHADTGTVIGDDYPAKWAAPTPMDSVLDTWGEYNRECTSFVAWRLSSQNGFTMPFHDNATGWINDAKAKNYTVDGNPAVGAVAATSTHVAWVAVVSTDKTKVTVEEYDEVDSNHDGIYGDDGTYSSRTVAASTFQYIHFKDLSADSSSSNGNGGGGAPPVQPDNLAFINLQYVNGSQHQVQVIAYSQSSNYGRLAQNDVTGYPDTTNPPVVPLFNPKNGDLCFVNMTYYQGQVQLVCYSEASNYATMDLNVLTPYGSSSTYNPYIIPEFEPDGDLAFIYTQYYQGQVQIVAYSMASGYQTASQIDMTHYSDYTNVSQIRPLFENNGDLAFINLQYVNGSQQQTQVVAYTMSSGYTVLSQNIVTGYPDVPTASLGAIVPLFNGNGDLSFVNLAYYSGQVQVVGYSQASNYGALDMNDVTGYPDTTNPPVVPAFERISS